MRHPLGAGTARRWRCSAAAQPLQAPQQRPRSAAAAEPTWRAPHRGSAEPAPPPRTCPPTLVSKMPTIHCRRRRQPRDKMPALLSVRQADIRADTDVPYQCSKLGRQLCDRWVKSRQAGWLDPQLQRGHHMPCRKGWSPFEVAEADALGEALLVEAALDTGAQVLEDGGVHLLDAAPPVAAAAHVAVLHQTSFSVKC